MHDLGFDSREVQEVSLFSKRSDRPGPYPPDDSIVIGVSFLEDKDDGA
jgi:hypothetical protein